MLISLFVSIIWGAWIQRVAVANQDTCGRDVKFNTEKDGYALQGHVIKNLSLQLSTRDPCRGQCVMESSCVSINIGPPINNKVVCELSDSDHRLHPDDLKPRAGFTYTATENACSTHPCLYNGTCLNGFTNKRYQCVCTAYSTGENCEIALFQTCRELYDNNMSKGNKAYPLKVGSATIPVYCHMTDDLGACGGGGWTLVMKIDGSKETFHYDSNLWINQDLFDLTGGKTGLDTFETKLPTYWNTPFSKICLGMKIAQQINFIVINKQANSLYSLIADGQYRTTSLGRNTWKTLIGSQASLQLNCNKEGFNVACTASDSKPTRIGIISNNENDCVSCNSWIGFGRGGDSNDINTCGNAAKWESDNGDKYIKSMGYILVQREGTGDLKLKLINKETQNNHIKALAYIAV
ncbi:uncharacterized protein LOC144636371 isoform X1 [Oculina patagonica]